MPSFYINTLERIPRSWHQDGYTTIEIVKEEKAIVLVMIPGINANASQLAEIIVEGFTKLLTAGRFKHQCRSRS
jgi:hypothetical protein